MRIGQNPAKMGLPAYRPKQLGIAVLSYIPSQEGYFAQSLEILRYQVASIHRSTPDFDLLVFDNGSCAEVQEELRQLLRKGLINTLVLSRFNLGKTGALNWIFSAMPNEIICYSDSDVFFKPGWYEHSLDLLDTFPNVGFVTAQPCLFDVLGGTGSAHHAIDLLSGVDILEIDIPPDAENEYVRGVDNGSAGIRDHLLKRWKIIRHRETGKEGIIGASHMQFLARRNIIEKVFPLPARFGLSREDDRFFNLRVDQLGLLQLSTREFYVFHMGNRLDEHTYDEIRTLKLDDILSQPELPWNAERLSSTENPAKRRAFRLFALLSRWTAFRNLIRRFYNFLFEFFAQGK